MRFDALELWAYGPFDGRILDLSAGDCGLHVIHGGNEAGKSTCLRAVTAFLFGFPQRTDDDWGRRSSDLRIGATVRDEGEGAVRLVRRKGNKDTLRHSDGDGALGTPMVSKDWDRVLGGLDENLYHAFFGLDHETLRQGAEQILQDGGDLGLSLMGASLGSRRLREVEERLKDESDALFVGVRGMNQRIPQLLKDRKALIEQKRDALCSVVEFDRRREAVEDARSRLAERDAEHRRLVERKTQLDRVAECRKRLERRRQLVLATKSLPAVPPDFAFAVTQLQADRERARTEVETTTRELEARERDLAGSVLSPEQERILEQSRELRDLEARRVTVSDSLQRLEARDFADFLALDAKSDRRVPADFDPETATELRRLAESAEALEDAEREAREDLVASRAKVTELETEVASLGEIVDVAPLRRELAATRDEVALDREIRDREESLATRSKELERSVAREFGDGVALEELVRARWPEPARVRELRDRLREVDLAIDRLETEIRASEQTVETAERQIESESLVVELPDPTALPRLREERDRIWSWIRTRWLADAMGPAGTDGPPKPDRSDAELASDFEARVGSSDSLADRLRSEAEAVQQRLDRRARLAEEQDSLNRRRASVVDKVSDRRALAQQSAEMWSTALGEIPTVALAEDVLERRLKLASEATALMSASDELEARRRRRRSIRERLVAASSSLGVSPHGMPSSGVAALDDQWLGPVYEAIEEFCDATTERDKRRAALEASLRSARGQCAEQERLLERRQSASTTWRERFSILLDSFGLPASTTADEALVETARFERMRSQERDRELLLGFGHDAGALLAKLETTFDERRPDMAVRHALEQLGEAEALRDARVQADAECRQWRAQRQRAVEQLDRLEHQWAERVGRLVGTEFCPQGDRPPEPSEVAAFVEVWQAEQDRQKELRSIEDGLLQAFAPRTIDDLEAEADEFAEVDVDAELQLLAGSIDDAGARRDEAVAHNRDAERDLEELDGGAAAAEIAEQIESLQSELSDVVRRVRVLETARELLRRRIDDYRKEHQGPVLEHASTAFSRLTGGGFSGLDVEWGEETARFVAVRDGGSRLEIDHLSSGTRDQLFLALKVATIATLIDSGEAPRMPCVFDDVLVHFDDERTGRAIAVLAELAEHTQVLVFTHHEHVAHLAEQASDRPAGVFVHRLETS